MFISFTLFFFVKSPCCFWNHIEILHARFILWKAQYCFWNHVEVLQIVFLREAPCSFWNNIEVLLCFYKKPLWFSKSRRGLSIHSITRRSTLIILVVFKEIMEWLSRWQTCHLNNIWTGTDGFHNTSAQLPMCRPGSSGCGEVFFVNSEVESI